MRKKEGVNKWIFLFLIILYLFISSGLVVILTKIHTSFILLFIPLLIFNFYLGKKLAEVIQNE